MNLRRLLPGAPGFRARGLLAGSVLVAFALACSAGPPLRVAGPDAVRVLTYNVNWGMPGPAEALAAIRLADADVVMLQETTPNWEATLRRELADDYPEMHFRHAGAAGGQALLSRMPARELVRG